MKNKLERLFFAVVLLAVAAVSVWWMVWLTRTIRIEYRFQRSELMHNAMVAALLLGQKHEKPAPGPLSGSMPLEVVGLDSGTSVRAAAALPLHPDRAVRPQPAALKETEQNYRRRKLLLVGASILLAVLVVLLGFLYFRGVARMQNSTPTFQPIGRIRTPYSPENRPPLPLTENEPEARLELSPAFAEGLFELEKFRYLHVLYWLDRPNKSWSLRVRPPRGGGREVGLFASRSPHRPFPVGLTVARIIRIEGHTVITSAIDAFDNTPLLDLKPYFKDADCRTDAGNGWLDEVSTTQSGRTTPGSPG